MTEVRTGASDFGPDLLTGTHTCTYQRTGTTKL
jgi:hypothetical protein